tara:strand:+ start:2192 stop:3064 length:873 start_codon:yes stop_codon:yes gene_type:complete
MSKIKVDTLETNNQNIKLSPDGTGVVEVKAAGGAEGTLKLVSSNGSNAVKIKSPAHSAQQSHTLVLPDNLPTTGNYLKLKSISGTPANEVVGQLEYADVPTADLTQLNANDITSGTVPVARFPSPLAATAGAALKLISKTTVTGSNVATLTISIPTQDEQYFLLMKRMHYTNNSGLGFELLDANGTANNMWSWGFYGSSDSYYDLYNSKVKIQTGWNRECFGGYMYINALTEYANVFGRFYALSRDENAGKFYAYQNYDTEIHSLRFSDYGGSNSIAPNTQLLLYQIIDS